LISESILVVGAGGHARACVDVIEQEGRLVVKGLVGLPDEVGSEILGYPVLGVDSDLPELLSDYPNALVAVGQIKTPGPRMRFFDQLQQSGFNLPVIVSPHAYVSPHAKLNAGTIVMHGAVINAGAVVGKNCIINSQSLVEHDVVIEDHCHIATAATINGGVRIGMGTFLGSNSCVSQCLEVGESCVIGMGQQVLADCEAGTNMPSKRLS
jgi:sugar O-acyltransferase (sialic acid O-acetyltransferase NeuD family)